jgi:3-oxoacyl-[acyl-carrier protein] reductase
MKLENKVAIITGSSRGIGKATALLFAREGAKVVVTYKSNKEKAKEVVVQIKKNKGTAIMVQVDLAKQEDIKNLFRETLKAFGTVDILVNNAASYGPKPFAELTKEDLLEEFNTNLVGPILCAQEAGKIMLEKKKGKIINIASVSGLVGFGRPGNLHYAVAKAGIINFTGVLAMALAPYVNVNGIAPGGVETDMARGWDAAYREKMINGMYLKRLVTTEDIAKACLFLASDDSSGMTGETIAVDAGYHLK